MEIRTSICSWQSILGQRMVYTYRLKGLAGHSACQDEYNDEDYAPACIPGKRILLLRR